MADTEQRIRLYLDVNPSELQVSNTSDMVRIRIKKPELHFQMEIQRNVLDAAMKVPVQEAQQVNSAVSTAYKPERFLEVKNEQEAKDIILTADEQVDGFSTNDRWEKETPELLKMISHWTDGRAVRILDWGTGIGRIAKPLCEAGCEVVGVDISPKMLELAKDYVQNDKYHPMTVQEFMQLDATSTFDYACAIWVLQHSNTLEQDIAWIGKALRNGGELFVVNNKESRAVPVEKDKWLHDGKDIWKELAYVFPRFKCLRFPEVEGLEKAQYNRFFDFRLYTKGM